MIIAVDIGATNISIASFTLDGESTGSIEFQAGQKLSAKAFLAILSDKIAQAITDTGSLHGIGVGSCGIVKNGKILYSPNTSWKSLPLKDELEERFKAPTKVINDADAFALGVFHYEFKGRFESLCAITLGSGLGGAVISKGGIFSSYAGISPELGHTTIKKNGRLCTCGRRGCLEAYASERALLGNYKRLKGKAKPVNARRLFALWKSGDPSARVAFQRFGEDLGIGLASLHAIFSTEAFVLGGGISRASPAFLDYCRQTLNRNLILGFPKRPKVLVSKFLRKASLLGAFHIVKESVGK